MDFLHRAWQSLSTQDSSILTRLDKCIARCFAVTDEKHKKLMELLHKHLVLGRVTRARIAQKMQSLEVLHEMTYDPKDGKVIIDYPFKAPYLDEGKNVVSLSKRVGKGVHGEVWLGALNGHWVAVKFTKKERMDRRFTDEELSDAYKKRVPLGVLVDELEEAKRDHSTSQHTHVFQEVVNEVLLHCARPLGEEHGTPFPHPIVFGAIAPYPPSKYLYCMVTRMFSFSLEELVKRIPVQTTFDVEREEALFDVMMQILNYIGALQERIGYIHGDFHMGNVMVVNSSQQEVVYEDYGEHTLRSTYHVKFIDHGFTCMSLDGLRPSRFGIATKEYPQAAPCDQIYDKKSKKLVKYRGYDIQKLFVGLGSAKFALEKKGLPHFWEFIHHALIMDAHLVLKEKNPQRPPIFWPENMINLCNQYIAQMKDDIKNPKRMIQFYPRDEEFETILQYHIRFFM